MADCVLAACGQIGDIGRSFETFEAYAKLQLRPGANTYNAVLSGCIQNNLLESVPKVRTYAIVLRALRLPARLSISASQVLPQSFEAQLVPQLLLAGVLCSVRTKVTCQQVLGSQQAQAFCLSVLVC